MVDAIIAMAHSLRPTVLAEGVDRRPACFPARAQLRPDAGLPVFQTTTGGGARAVAQRQAQFSQRSSSDETATCCWTMNRGVLATRHDLPLAPRRGRDETAPLLDRRALGSWPLPPSRRGRRWRYSLGSLARNGSRPRRVTPGWLKTPVIARTLVQMSAHVAWPSRSLPGFACRFKPLFLWHGTC
jgi:hypothetical protein